MIQENKELLLKDICGRLPYGIICTDNRHGDSRVFYIDIEDESVYYTDFDEYGLIENCKLYLRPMSSMTEEEYENFRKTFKWLDESIFEWTYESYDWLNAHHFDYRGLICLGSH